jgi:predicted metalloprotease with PDZ domain
MSSRSPSSAPSAAIPPALSRLVLLLALGTTPLAAPLAAQLPLRSYADAFEARHARTDPVLRYELAPAPTRPGFDVTLTIRNAPDTLRLALPIWAPGAYRVVNFSRFVHDVRADGRAGSLAVTRDGCVERADTVCSTWRVAPGGDSVTVRYHVDFPNAAAAAPSNRSFLTATGALVDGPATYLALVGHELAPAHVRFTLPDDWRVVTGLVPTSDPRTFFAPSYDVLIDSPTLLGAADVHVWPFTVDGIPHRAAYWRAPPPRRSTAWPSSMA